MNDPAQNAEFNAIKENLIKTYSLAFHYDVEEFQNSEKFKELMQKLCEVKAKKEMFDEIFETSQNAETLKEFDKLIEEGRKKKFSKKIEKEIKNELKNFDKVLSEVSNEMLEKKRLKTTGTITDTTNIECDDMVMTAKFNPIDPISKQRMTDPVRNVNCGHVYERKYILEAIRINKNMRCPEIGCANRNCVAEKHLVDDIKMRMELLRVSEDMQDNDDNDF